jgi:hypothetical protein
MAEQDKKKKEEDWDLFNKRLAEAMESLKGQPLPTDIEMFVGDMPKEMPGRTKKK